MSTKKSKKTRKERLAKRRAKIIKTRKAKQNIASSILKSVGATTEGSAVNAVYHLLKTKNLI